MSDQKTMAPDNRKDSRLQNAKYVAINAFLIFHIVAIACWCLPVNNSFSSHFRLLVRPYFLFTGLFQSWDTFSPTPKMNNTYADAIVIYRDGSRKTWAFPRMQELSLPERYAKERYRKYSDNLAQDNLDILLPDAAREIARLNSTPSNPAKTVILMWHWSPIVRAEDGSYAPQPWDQHVLIGYGVRPGDLGQ